MSVPTPSVVSPVTTSTRSRPLQRLIRFKDAPKYLGMDKNRFNKEVRPFVISLRIGKQGVAFDRLDLDAWVDDYKSRSRRPTKNVEEKLWGVKKCQGSLKEVNFGTSTKLLMDDEFMKALDRAICRKQKNI